MVISCSWICCKVEVRTNQNGISLYQFHYEKFVYINNNLALLYSFVLHFNMLQQCWYIGSLRPEPNMFLPIILSRISQKIFLLFLYPVYYSIIILILWLVA